MHLSNIAASKLGGVGGRGDNLVRPPEKSSERCSLGPKPLSIPLLSSALFSKQANAHVAVGLFLKQNQVVQSYSSISNSNSAILHTDLHKGVDFYIPLSSGKHSLDVKRLNL